MQHPEGVSASVYRIRAPSDNRHSSPSRARPSDRKSFPAAAEESDGHQLPLTHRFAGPMRTRSHHRPWPSGIMEGRPAANRLFPNPPTDGPTPGGPHREPARRTDPPAHQGRTVHASHAAEGVSLQSLSESLTVSLETWAPVVARSFVYAETRCRATDSGTPQLLIGSRVAAALGACRPRRTEAIGFRLNLCHVETTTVLTICKKRASLSAL